MRGQMLLADSWRREFPAREVRECPESRMAEGTRQVHGRGRGRGCACLMCECARGFCAGPVSTACVCEGARGVQSVAPLPRPPASCCAHSQKSLPSLADPQGIPAASGPPLILFIHKS